ncbi:hypothetical protein [Ancylobacter vacuolatus]|uniref:Uncharacterized protein n=1 Tax=Ancylobacter vacuolatus TaxID=223389 RepID=A0ABU0DN93_9HYPH|nr:hypothetical protein [Ancylobacter vacuolatus]MDQ0349768.1 hypothetical protein [Ancylobacter vacuolatus]
MAIVHDGLQIVGMVDDGDLAAELSAEILRVNAAIKERAGQKGKAKGTVTLVLNLEQEGGILAITGDIKVALPKKKRGASMYWVMTDGAISTEHPQQMNMFSGPRGVNAREPAAG